MIAYVGSSVLLRVILGQRNRLKHWNKIQTGVASALVEVECLRTLDRLRLKGSLSGEELALRRETVYRLMEEMEVMELGPTVLSRASQPLPTTLGNLNAIHLSSALIWREQNRAELVMATHDLSLATAAKACGLEVTGT
jgi:predicted nucleic acid-binding protein